MTRRINSETCDIMLPVGAAEREPWPIVMFSGQLEPGLAGRAIGGSAVPALKARLAPFCFCSLLARSWTPTGSICCFVSALLWVSA